MDWEKNAQGNVIVNPLVDYQIAEIHGVGCLVRLELSDRADSPRTVSKSVQVGIDIDTASALARDLQKMVQQILSGRPDGQAN
jgi:hypothetical protein